MLETHIDIEIYIDAYKKFMSDPFKNSKGFINFLTEGTDLILYGIDNLEMTSTDTINVLSQLTQGIGEKTKRPKKISTAFFPANTLINEKNPYQVFFLNVTDREDQVRIINTNQLLTGFITNYDQVFNEFKNEPFFRVDDNITKNKFTRWEQILPNTTVTDIIISDPFLFEFGEEEMLLKENYYKLLIALKGKYLELNNVLVFSSIKDINNLNDIRIESKKILGTKIKFGISLFHQESEHDRHIFMNYHHIKVGSSLNFLFDKTGSLKVKKKSTIKVESYSNPDNFVEAVPVLEFLNQRLAELKLTGKVPKFTQSRLFS